MTDLGKIAFVNWSRAYNGWSLAFTKKLWADMTAQARSPWQASAQAVADEVERRRLIVVAASDARTDEMEVAARRMDALTGFKPNKERKP